LRDIVCIVVTYTKKHSVSCLLGFEETKVYRSVRR